MGEIKMKKRYPRPQFTQGTINRFGQSRIGGGVQVLNSNARILQPGEVAPRHQPSSHHFSPDNLGLNSARLRAVMVERLRQEGISDERVLQALNQVPRHHFVDEGLASHAYENAALPIGFQQTISQPWIVARMIALVCSEQIPHKVLEIGAGCGYQAAVLAQLIPQVYAIERIRGLYELAIQNIQHAPHAERIHLHYGDGLQGLPQYAPFPAIIVAAAGIELPRSLLRQLSVGGRLVAPLGQDEQHLVLIERTGMDSWSQQLLEPVRFVPLRQGTQP